MNVRSFVLAVLVTSGAIGDEPAVPTTPHPVSTSDAKAVLARGRKTEPSGTRDSLDLDTTTITGNRELPKVMYVVPWKRADLGDLGGRPANSLLDEVLAPVDRDVFRRQLSYFEEIDPDIPERAVPAGGPEPVH